MEEKLTLWIEEGKLNIGINKRNNPADRKKVNKGNNPQKEYFRRAH